MKQKIDKGTPDPVGLMVMVIVMVISADFNRRSLSSTKMLGLTKPYVAYNKVPYVKWNEHYHHKEHHVKYHIPMEIT